MALPAKLKVRPGLPGLLVLSAAACLICFCAGAAVPHAPAEHKIARSPVTRSLTAAEAMTTQEKDWLFQAGGKPLAAQARQELGWARALGARIGKMPGAPSLQPELQALNALETRYSRLKEPGPNHPARPSSQLPPGLLARFSFEPGEPLKCNAETDYDSGVFGRCLALDGAMIIHADPNLSRIVQGEYTLSAWIRTTSGEADIIGNGVTAGQFLLMTYRGVTRGHHWTDASGNVIDGQTRVNDDRWHHLVQVVDATNISLFVDGKLDARQRFRGRRIHTPSPVVVGGRTTSHPSFAGFLDDVCVYGRALGAAEIASEFQAGIAAQRESVAQFAAGGDEARDFYLAVRRVKRALAFKNPAVDFTSVLFIDNPYPEGAEWQHQARHRNGMMAVPGGRLLALEGLSPAGKLRQLGPSAPGSFWRPDLSFDGQRVLFCFKPAAEQSFHLYECKADGNGMRQLTDGPYDDLDPLYLPDGHIVFCTSRCNTYVRCMPYTYSYVLARCKGDGSNIFLISQNNEPDWCPALLHDGRLVYSRWEYHDKALWRIQSLWTANPDGTGVATFWGNQSVWPDHLAEARPIPNSRRVMFTGVAHHNWFAGSIGILDPARGFNFPQGLTKVTCELPWPECGKPPVDPLEVPDYHSSGRFGAYKTPYPISADDFLVSAQRDGKFHLYLMDLQGNRELIYEGAYNIWHAMPIKLRSSPPVLTDRVNWPDSAELRSSPEQGSFYSANVCEGVPELTGKVKYLRLIQMNARTCSTWTRDGRFSGPVVSAVQDDGVKQVLGTVPIESDGSVNFTVPAGAAVHFQLLDDQYRALQTMRSFTGVLPGEKRGCVGCHEQHATAPANIKGLAFGRTPSTPLPPPWGAGGISFERHVQPVFNRHCGSCHQGSGEARKKLDLTLRPAQRPSGIGAAEGSGPFKEPYLSLVGPIGFGLVKQPSYSSLAGVLPAENFDQSDPDSYRTIRPMLYLSYASKLIANACSGAHHQVQLPPADRQLLIAWVDTNCPYRNEEDIHEIPDPTFAGVETLPIRPQTRSAPSVPRP